MLSRFSSCGGQTFKKCLINLQPASTLTTSAVSSSACKTPAAGTTGTSPAARPEYPPPGSKRDFINFPRPVLRERPPPVRLGFIPDSWFQMFYPKTGYTGPYVFLLTFGTYLYSKEIIIHDHNMAHCYAFILLCLVAHNKFGDKIAEGYNKLLDREFNLVDGEQEGEKQYLRDEIAFLQSMKPVKEAVAEVLKARTEVVHLQMESAFRDRLAQTYKMIKQRLDCQVELENADRRIKQRNLVDYVIGNVMKSITPDLEKSAMEACIRDLNALSAKA